MKQHLAVFLVFVFLSTPLAGCFAEEAETTEATIESVWNFEKNDLTWYHYADAVDAWGNDSVVLEGRNLPFPAEGTYSVSYTHLTLPTIYSV